MGVATSITERLARIRSLRVLPTTSVVHYEGRTINPRAVGRELGVSHLLLSTLRTEENAYRISVQLVETRDAATLSAGSFTVGRNSLMDVEAQVANRVVRAFNLGLSTGEKLGLARQYTSYTAAYTNTSKAVPNWCAATAHPPIRRFRHSTARSRSARMTSERTQGWRWRLHESRGTCS